MSKVKSNVTAILTDVTKAAPFAAIYFRVGAVPLNAAGEPAEGMVPVKSIVYAKKTWGQGAQVDRTCYGIKFVDSDETIIIHEENATQITLSIKEEASKKAAPELPE